MSAEGAAPFIEIQTANQADIEGQFASLRRPHFTYVSRTTTRPGHPGVPARYIHKVFDGEEDEPEMATAPPADDQWIVEESPGGRSQVKLLVSREAGHVSEVWLQRVRYTGGNPTIHNVFNLRGDNARRLVELLKALDVVPVEGGDTVRVDDDLLRDLLRSPESLAELYARDPEAFRRLIADDQTADDVVGLQRRRAEVQRFRRLIEDAEYFAQEAAAAPGHSREKVWQLFFEANPWVLGTGLGGQLYTSWDSTKLEQVVGGSSIAEHGKRVDALMRTAGVVRWMTFAEIKVHTTPLLSTEPRPGAWSASPDLVAGVAQAQATVRRAMREIDGFIVGTAADGSDLPHDLTFLSRPRSFLVVGSLSELMGSEGGTHRDKVHSFELFRRSLADPEIVTFDELLERAEWVVDTQAR